MVSSSCRAQAAPYASSAHTDRCRERLAAAAVEQPCLAFGVDQASAVAVRQGVAEEPGDLFLRGTVEHRRGQLGVATDVGQADIAQPVRPRAGGPIELPTLLGPPSQMGL